MAWPHRWFPDKPAYTDSVGNSYEQMMGVVQRTRYLTALVAVVETGDRTLDVVPTSSVLVLMRYARSLHNSYRR